jgi:hypothetical protein
MAQQMMAPRGLGLLRQARMHMGASYSCTYIYMSIYYMSMTVLLDTFVESIGGLEMKVLYWLQHLLVFGPSY